MKKFILILGFTLTSCVSFQYPEEIILDYPVEKIINWNESLNMKEDFYYLYFYSKTCGHCLKFKQTFLSYYFKNDIVCYFVDCTQEGIYGEDETKIIGVNNINNLYILGTPTLLLIENAMVKKCFSGVTHIEEFMNNKF